MPDSDTTKYVDYRTTATGDDVDLSSRSARNRYSAVGARSQPNLDAYSGDLSEVIQSVNIVDRRNMDWYNKFNRFGIIDPYNAMTTTKEYLFITRPDLHIINTYTGRLSGHLKNQPIFVDAVERYRDVIAQLQYSYNREDATPFCPLLSNSITSSLSLPDLDAETIESGSNVYGTHLTYRGTSLKSDQDFSFSLEFEDTKYLEVYMFFKLYDEYEKLKWLGMTGPSWDSNNNTYFEDDERWVNYTLNKVLHDQMSIYKIVVGEDGMTIVYFARITGIMPVSAPRSAFSDMNNNDGQKLTVQWKGHFVQDMNPIILNNFNQLVYRKVRNRSDLPLYNQSAQIPDGRWSTTPYIYMDTSNTSTKGRMGRYYLMWKQ